MRAWAIPILGAVALSLGVPSATSARPRFGPAALLGAVSAPLGARLTVAADRLVMLFAVMTVGTALQDFYESLDDRQKRSLRQLERSRGMAGKRA
jgi:hypothetical protein